MNTFFKPLLIALMLSISLAGCSNSDAQPSGSITLNKASLTLNESDSETLIATVTSDDKTVVWSSSNSSIATVDNAGKVTAVKAGTTTITAKTSTNKTATCAVTVNAVEFVLNKTSLTLSEGEIETLTATGAVTWSSSNNSIARVDNYGNVAGIKEGTATITVKTANNNTLTCAVTVQTASTVTNGTAGSLLWKLTSKGALIISGNGAMPSEGTYTWFAHNTSIYSIVIADGVTSIGNFAFSNIENLVNISIAGSVSDIGMGAFKNCRKLLSVVIPEGVIILKDVIFDDCHNLKNITIPNSVTSIGDRTFCNCQSLKNVTLPNKLTSIGPSAFSNCWSWKEVIIPNTVISVGNGAFDGCSSFKNIIIPASVTSIGEDAFRTCGFTEVSVLATTPPTAGGNLYISKTIPVYVPQASLETYKNANYWKTLNLQGKVF